MARAHPPAALELPTAPQAPYDVKKHTYHPKSPPRTPLLPISRAAKGKGKAKAARRPAVNKTFDDDAREDTNVYKRSRSDSHGLSWSPRQTRDSVVDNMLLSLDQLFVPATSVDDGSSNGYSPVTATDPHCASPDLTTTRARGPAHASSEHDSQSDEIESHSTNPPSHRHRSNSSTNYQPALGRIDSVRAMDEGKAVKSLEQSPGNKRMGGPGGRSVATPTSRRKGSKSSGSSSIDFGQMMGGPRWQRAVERRSSSFDHGYNIRTSVLVPGASASISNPNNMKHSQTIPYMNDDAAPTPTVPAGPRGASVPSTAATAFPIQAGGSTAQSLPLRRKDSKRAPAMLFLRHEVGDGADLSGKQGAVKSRPHSRTTSKDALANSIDVDSAVPNSSLLIPKIAETASQSSTSHARERPGFFRRVFGSSRNTVPVVNEMQMPQTYQSSTHSASRAESRTGQNTGSAKYSRVPRNSPVTLGPKDSPQDPPQANLNKKPSFFRWRKKSLSDDTPLPFSPVFLQHQLHHTSTPAVESSPASSLRKVMNPYLSTPATASTLRQHSDSTGTLLGRSKIPVFLPSDDSMSNSHLTTAEADTATFGTSKEDSPLPMSRYNLHASGPSSSEPHSSTEHHVDQVLSTNNDHTIFKDRDKGPGVMERPVDINLVLDRVPFKEDENIASTMSHSRSGSDEELPKLPIKIQPLSHSDFNIPKPKFPAIITKKSSGKDWNSASILLTPTKDDSSPNTSSHRSPRVWLKPTASEEDLRDSAKQPLSNDPIWPSADSTPGISNSASLKLPAPTLEITPQIQYPLDSSHNANDVSCGAQEALELSSVEPTENDRILAKKIFNEDDDATENSGAAAWLGDCGLSRARVRAAYLDLFDWHNLNILAALRSFCGRLLLKGETQQIDRILSAFSTRWCVCNPTHGFKAT
ncbi:hypothetical protein MMC13_000354, partial [Lambiella insularis]|nr:hypothetical protein [Lambiella insularis]